MHKRSRDGAFWGAKVAQLTMEKALACHQCGLSSNPGNDTVIRPFFPEFADFPTPSITNFS